MDWLLTWIWQGMLWAVAMWALLRWWRPNAATRYAVAWITLLAIVAMPLVARYTVRDPAAETLPALPSATASEELATVDAHNAAWRPVTLPQMPSWLLVFLIGGWLSVALIDLVRVAW